MLDLHGWGMAAGPFQMEGHGHDCWGIVWAEAGRPPAALQMPVCHLLQWSVNSTHPVRHLFTLFAEKLKYCQQHLKLPRRHKELIGGLGMT